MFPPIESALDDPNGLLAMGGDLSPTRLIEAYSQGIFPWYEQGQPLLWWSPDPRAILFPERVHVSRSLRRTMRRENYRLSLDTAFIDVLEHCSAPRSGSEGTWITPEMKSAYTELFYSGYAHSVEVWSGDELVGGLYGVTMRGIFSGESMFHLQPDTSKIAFVALCKHLQKWGWPIIDCQINNPHLQSLGSEEIPRREFKRLLQGGKMRTFGPGFDFKTSAELGACLS